MRIAWVSLCVIAGCLGCARWSGYNADGLAPVAEQQMRACTEAVTGRFVSLVDFEPVRDHPHADQTRHFSLRGADGGTLRRVYNITHTGTGAMAVELHPDGSLVFRSPYVRDLRPYTLLSLAVYMRQTRDDLQVTLAGPLGVWRSGRRLVKPGWNTVLVDLPSLERHGHVDLGHFDAIGLRFAAAEEPVNFILDDILLIDNRRRIPHTPAGVTVMREGLDFTIHTPGRTAPIRLRFGEDGLARLGPDQPLVQLSGRGHQPAGDGEDLRLMGDRKLGRVELLEANALRVRIANTWYFPPQAGRWFDMDVRQIRWEYTFYADGRWVTSMLLNNAGGEELTAVDILTPAPTAFADGSIGWRRRVADFDGLIARAAMLTIGDGDETLLAGFARPADAVVRMGRPVENLPGCDDGFCEAEGCYLAAAEAGHCRIELTPADSPLPRPVIRVIGAWRTVPAVNCDGLPLRPVVKIDDGVLVAVPTTLQRSAVIEFTGEPGEPTR